MLQKRCEKNAVSLLQREQKHKNSEKQKLIDGFNPQKYKKYNWKEKYNPVMDGFFW